MFFFENHEENNLGRLVLDLFLFFKIALYKVKAGGEHLSFNMFWYSSTWAHNKNKLYKTPDCWSRDMFNFDFSEQGLELVSPHILCMIFQETYFSILFSMDWPNFHCVIAFTSWDIWYVILTSWDIWYCNCLLSSLWRHKFWNFSQLSYQAVFLHDQKLKTQIKIFQERKEILKWNKNNFSWFLKDFQLLEFISDLSSIWLHWPWIIDCQTKRLWFWHWCAKIYLFSSGGKKTQD